MAFAYEIKEESNAIGRKKQVIGTFTNTSGGTGGAIPTGLTQILHVSFTHSGATVVASAPAYTVSGGIITLKTVADADGTFVAYGI